ncbi:hypothetical protein GCM10007887_31810 [Methylobacterium haplocladii]|uniref:DUF4268 domain-containing protein n=1 Tax=Methylobacterium haplocladii TaxID=1176176 RepID=A0A512ITM7_9HYPH|nr:hypothetical protein MHA02_34470 [Methylobacterium haplocladii]GLS60502.1 hypothetical protein GCM10007887_31810 [Methylobacterium haplocladii]
MPDLDQAAFVDNVTRNLAQGRVLLLVLGDGIREGVEAIASYIQGTTGLHFTFGLVEMQIFEVGEGQLIVQPRVLTKTLIVNRSVVALAGNDLKLVDEVEAAGPEESRILEPSEREARHKQFWVDLLTTIRLDDAEQPLANPLSQPNIFFRMPTPGMWLTCYFSQKEGGIGIFLGSDRTSAVAMAIGLQLEIDREDITNEIGLPVVWSRDGNGKVRVAASKRYPKLGDPAVREEQLQWFREAINAFVNALRPRIATSLREVATGNASTAN